MANAACLGPPCSPVAKSAATDAPGLSAATSSTGGAVSSSRLRSAEGPRRQDPQRLHTNVQIFATTRRQSVSLIVPRPWCAGPTSDYVGAMPARSRKSLATSAQHAAKKSKQVHGEPSSTSPSEVVDPMDVEHGEPMRTTVPIRPDPALSADAMPAPRHRATGIDASDGWT